MKIPPDDLDAAVMATFERRQTQIPNARPPGLSQEMIKDPEKQKQWGAYAATLELDGLELGKVIGTIWSLIEPACKRIMLNHHSIVFIVYF